MSTDVSELFTAPNASIATELLSLPLPHHSHKARRALLRDTLLDAILGKQNDPEDKQTCLDNLISFVRLLPVSERKLYVSLLKTLLPPDEENNTQLTTNNTLVIVDQTEHLNKQTRQQRLAQEQQPTPEINLQTQRFNPRVDSLPMPTQFLEKQDLVGAALSTETEIESHTPTLKLKLPVR